MRHTCLIAAGVLLVAAMSAQTTGDEKAIQDLDAAWIKAAQDRDADKAASFYADDAMMMPPGAPMATTPEQRRAAWQSLLSDPNTTVNFGRTRLEVAKDGDIAYDVGWVELKTSDAQGNTTTRRGKYLVVWKKIRGEWKVVADTFNHDN